MTRIQLNTKIDSLPPVMKQEVIDFIEFLESKLMKKKLNKGRGYGALKGRIKIKPGFDEPLEDFKEYM